MWVYFKKFFAKSIIDYYIIDFLKQTRMLFLFWADIELPGKWKHDISGQAIVPNLCATLGVHLITGAAQLMQQVETCKLCDECALHETAAQMGIPHPIRGIHHAIVVAPAGI